MPELIVGVRFTEVGKTYHFDASAFPDLQVGDSVVVETARGRQLGRVALFVKTLPEEAGGRVKPIERLANPRDLILRRKWQQKEAEALVKSRERLARTKFSHVKLIYAEFSFDGSRLAIMYSSETDEKVDLKFLRQDLRRSYPNAQIEMHQIGPRDVAKYLGGMGACGLESRCCTRFLTEFSPISIKMAKEQGISLTPAEITGMCGRLRCCLVYEFEQYVAARKELPKRGKQVVTPQGDGRVVDVNPITMQVGVEFQDGSTRSYGRDALQPWDELEALRRKSQEPCVNCPEGNKAPKQT
jgi:cell fate regulator YaaT (PSP1 superfamily)